MTLSNPNNNKQRVVIVPCSGIGKTYGTVSREAAYEVTEDIRSDETQLVALSLLVLGDDEARAAVEKNPAITIDGCKLACATKMVKESGGTVAKDFAVLDVYRRYKQFKPQGIAELNKGGQQLARALAQEIAAVVDQCLSTSDLETASPIQQDDKLLYPADEERGQNG
jgi:uncharacterized metal-binding protein